MGKKQSVMWSAAFFGNFKSLNLVYTFCHSTKPKIYQNTTQHLTELLARGSVGFHGTVSLPLPTPFSGPEFPRHSDQAKRAGSVLVVLLPAVDTSA